MNTKQSVGRPVTKQRPPKPEFLEMPVLSGDSIGEASRRAVRLADAKKTKVRFRFHEVDLEVAPEDDPMDAVNFWMRVTKARSSPSPVASMLRIKLGGTDPQVEECQS